MAVVEGGFAVVFEAELLVLVEPPHAETIKDIADRPLTSAAVPFVTTRIAPPWVKKRESVELLGKDLSSLHCARWSRSAETCLIAPLFAAFHQDGSVLYVLDIGTICSLVHELQTGRKCITMPA